MHYVYAMNPHLLYALSGIGAILLLSTVIGILLQKRDPEKDYSELMSRIQTWWIMATIFCSAMVMNRLISITFFAFISFLALKEYLTLVPTRRSDRRVLLWAYLAIPLQYYWVATQWYGMFAIFIPVYMFLFMPFRAVMIGQTQGFLSAMATLHWGLMLMVYCISHIGFLLVLPQAPEQNLGSMLVLFVVTLTQLNDVAQYTFGKLFGKRKIIPLVSPNKTWEGFLGGLLTTTLLAKTLYPFFTPFTEIQAIVAGVLISSSGFIGDVSISALKRDLGIKDSGTLLPGHGGMLDRVDSLIYTAPLFFHYVRYLHF